MRSRAIGCWRRSICGVNIVHIFPTGMRQVAHRRRGCGVISKFFLLWRGAGLTKAAKDISQGGIVGTAIMLANAPALKFLSISIRCLPLPGGVGWSGGCRSFPSFGFLLSVAPQNVAAVIGAFYGARDCRRRHWRGARWQPGNNHAGWRSRNIWDYSKHALLGCCTVAHG